MTIVIAHRGASRAERENTLAAFRRAHEMQADWVELDVRRTQDGRLAIHHDPYLPDGRVLCDTPSDELPSDVPDLFAALDSCAGMGVNVEIKNWPSEPDFDPDNALAVAVVDVLSARRGRDRILISAFHLPMLDRVRELDPGLATAWLVDRIEADTFDQLEAHGHRVLHPWVRHLRKHHIDDAHERGITVNTWTCDDPQRMAQLIDWGVDGICTNVPDVARSLLPRPT